MYSTKPPKGHSGVNHPPPRYREFAIFHGGACDYTKTVYEYKLDVRETRGRRRSLDGLWRDGCCCRVSSSQALPPATPAPPDLVLACAPSAATTQQPLATLNIPLPLPLSTTRYRFCICSGPSGEQAIRTIINRYLRNICNTTVSYLRM